MERPEIERPTSRSLVQRPTNCANTRHVIIIVVFVINIITFCTLSSVDRRRCRLSSVVVCNWRGRSAATGPGAWPVRRPTLHGSAVRLRSDRATPCFFVQGPSLSKFRDNSSTTLSNSADWLIDIRTIKTEKKLDNPHSRSHRPLLRKELTTNWSQPQNTVESTPPPRNTEIGTVSLPPAFFGNAPWLAFPTSPSFFNQSTASVAENEYFSSCGCDLWPLFFNST